MQAIQDSQRSGTIHSLYHQPMQQIEPYSLSRFQILNDNVCLNNGHQGTQVSFQTCNEQFFTLDASPATDYVLYDSPSAVNILCNQSPFSPQCLQSYLSDPHDTPDNTYGSPLSGFSLVDDGNELTHILRELENDNTYGLPLSGFSLVDDGNELTHILRELENELLGPESDSIGGCIYSFNSVVPKTPTLSKYDQMSHRIPSLDLKQVLLACAEAVSNENTSTVTGLMDVLERMVSVTGEPIQRLGAYMLEGLRARLLSSGTVIYKKLNCKEPTGSELMSYMHVISQICPYYKFAYVSATVVIREAMENETRIHIIDFQIAQGSQWVSLIKALAHRRGGPPLLRITGVDDSQSAHARGGGLQLVGQKLTEVAVSCGVPFEFHGAAMSGSEVELENLGVRHGEALAVNFPYMLHHMPDESVNTTNSRDRLLRLVKSLSPKVVTLLELESNTNTAPFLPRFRETLDYYTAMFESIDAARPRDDKQRINAEEHCVARDIVNIIACEGAERVERYELFGKWRCRLTMAGFTPCPLSSSVGNAVRDMLKDYSMNYRVDERADTLYLGWKNRDLVTSSAWR